MTPLNEWRFHIMGWIFFTGSAIFYTWASARAGDMISVTASLLFLLACVIFLVPVIRTKPLN